LRACALFSDLVGHWEKRNADTIGTLEPGRACDLAVWDISAPAELVYRIGFNPLHLRVKDGECC